MPKLGAVGLLVAVRQAGSLGGGSVPTSPNSPRLSPVFTYSAGSRETCAQHHGRCSPHAFCTDYATGLCCHCQASYYGNGRQCLPEGTGTRGGEGARCPRDWEKRCQGCVFSPPRGRASPEREGERQPGGGEDARALPGRRPARLHRGQRRESLHGHQRGARACCSCPPAPPAPRRALRVALCPRGARLRERLQHHR